MFNPFIHFNPSKYTFAGIVLGVLVVAILRAALHF